MDLFVTDAKTGRHFGTGRKALERRAPMRRRQFAFFFFLPFFFLGRLVCMYVCIYKFIYKEREGKNKWKEGQREKDNLKQTLHLSTV